MLTLPPHILLIPYIVLEDAKKLFADGTISGGMIPKVECCMEAIRRGVKKVFIMDGRVPHSLLIETLTEDDVEGFKELDKYFKYIAEKGLVHANAQLLFPWDFFHMKRWNNEAYLMRLARYWVARYSCYPCLWTLAQEVDNDFYFSRGDHKRFTKEDNPFKILAKGMYKYDPHKHPLTAHMESYATSPEMTGDREGTCPSTSAFREVEGHTWWAYQWSRNLNAPIKYAFGEDNWLNGQGKVAVLYESRYAAHCPTFDIYRYPELQFGHSDVVKSAMIQIVRFG